MEINTPLNKLNSCFEKNVFLVSLFALFPELVLNLIMIGEEGSKLSYNISYNIENLKKEDRVVTVGDEG